MPLYATKETIDGAISLLRGETNQKVSQASSTPGPAGRGIASSKITTDGHLTLTYTDGTTVDLGVVSGSGSGGTAAPSVVIETFYMYQPDALAAGTGQAYMPMPPGTHTILGMQISMGTASSGSGVTIQPAVDDTTLFTDANSPVVAAGSRSLSVDLSKLKSQTFNGGGVGMSMNILGVGSASQPGANVTLAVRTSRPA